MKTIKILFLLTGLSISSLGFGMEDGAEDLRLVEAVLNIEDLALDGTSEQQENNIEKIKKLINEGVDVNQAKDGITPLLFASVIGPVEIV